MLGGMIGALVGGPNRAVAGALRGSLYGASLGLEASVLEAQLGWSAPGPSHTQHAAHAQGGDDIDAMGYDELLERFGDGSTRPTANAEQISCLPIHRLKPEDVAKLPHGSQTVRALRVASHPMLPLARYG